MSQNVVTYKRPPLLKALKRDMQLHFWKYVLILPILVYLALFCYKPMYGLVIAFKNYKPARGIWGSKWVGFTWFETFFKDPYFVKLTGCSLTWKEGDFPVSEAAAATVRLVK